MKIQIPMIISPPTLQTIIRAAVSEYETAYYGAAYILYFLPRFFSIAVYPMFKDKAVR